MKFKSVIKNLFASLALFFVVGCSSDLPGVEEQRTGTSKLVLQVALDGAADNMETDQGFTRGSFDNFDNQLDKWGIDGENMETLRVIIIDGRGEVEHNNLYTTENATKAGEYEYNVSSPDIKTIFLIANEGNLFIDTPGMEYMGASTSLKSYLSDLKQGLFVDTDELKKLTLSLDNNVTSISGLNKSMRTPLPITAVYEQKIEAVEGDVEETYVLHRAAVKYSFRIVNESNSPHTVEALHLSRVADKEFLFPDADWHVNEYGHTEVNTYRTPDSAVESEYKYIFSSPLTLPQNMSEAIEATDSPVYLTEGKISDSPQMISISIDGQPLSLWQELKWHRPEEDVSMARPMTDLPRNSHVVINITITDHDINFIACIQPYGLIELNPYFGLDRDPDGHIVVERYADNTYDVLIDGETVHKDINGDIIIKKFKDGTLLCQENIKKDYIHDDSEQDYSYYFEKDSPGGNMVIIRQVTNGDTYHGNDDLSMKSHEHGMNDRPLIVMDDTTTYYWVYYDSKGNPSLSIYDPDGNIVIQANGFQFREDRDFVGNGFTGTYIAQKPDGSIILLDAHTREKIEWDGETK